MKKLLGFVNDLRMRYKLATDLNFRDLGTSILEGDGGAFLRGYRNKSRVDLSPPSK